MFQIQANPGIIRAILLQLGVKKRAWSRNFHSLLTLLVPCTGNSAPVLVIFTPVLVFVVGADYLAVDEIADGPGQLALARPLLLAPIPPFVLIEL